MLELDVLMVHGRTSVCTGGPRAIRWTRESCPGSVDGRNDSFEFGPKPRAAPKRPPTLSLGRVEVYPDGPFPKSAVPKHADPDADPVCGRHTETCPDF